MTEKQSTVSRRGYLGAGAVALSSLAGCLGGLTGSSPAQQESFTLTITDEDGSLSSSVTPRDARGVISATVGDTIALDIQNETDGDIGVHNHVTEAEFVVEAGTTRTREFTPEESAIGRHEVEAYTVADENSQTHHNGTQTMTDHDAGNDTHDHDGNHHSDGTDTTETMTGSEHATDETEQRRSETDGHQHGAVTVLTVAVRPRS